MTRPGWRGAARGLALLALLGARPIAAHASTEEFANFSVATQEEDDESLIDHLLTRTPRAWRDEWERSAQALRTSQGCLTSGQWFLVNELKLTSAMGRRARFGVNLDQSESDETSYDNLDLSFHFPTRYGTPGAMFRPLHDKSRQDFALLWETGADTLAFHVQARFTFEDMFNNLWAFRQTRVGNASEPYERHPWEPAVRVALRRERWRGEIEGRFLTGSRKRNAAVGPGPDHIGTLWGTWAAGSVELSTGLGTLQARGTNRQALSTDQPVDLTLPDDRNFRRQWQGELVWIAPLGPYFEAEARALYQARSQRRGPPVEEGRLEAIDRAYQLEGLWHATPSLSARFGGLYDRVAIVQEGAVARFSHGTRTESRAYVGLVARFGRVSASVLECIELDPEPYPVWLVHDKGFFHLQATF